MRIGQKNTTTYQWSRRGTRPRQPADLRTENAYLFGAFCPDRDTGAALVMPKANTEAMQQHLIEISRNVAPQTHAIVLMDQASWHTTARIECPENLSLVFIPPASPELNPSENVWQYMRQTYLGNRVFEDYEDIVDHVCRAWCTLLEEAGRIQFITRRNWITIR